MSALIWSPFSSLDEAKRVAQALLVEELIVCANFMPGVHSLYRWRGEVEEGRECGALLKTDRTLLQKAVSRLEQLHPYETPAILGWDCDEAGVATRKWLGELESLGEG